jgi:hypothetical protein
MTAERRAMLVRSDELSINVSLPATSLQYHRMGRRQTNTISATRVSAVLSAFLVRAVRRIGMKKRLCASNKLCTNKLTINCWRLLWRRRKGWRLGCHGRQGTMYWRGLF